MYEGNAVRGLYQVVINKNQVIRAKTFAEDNRPDSDLTLEEPHGDRYSSLKRSFFSACRKPANVSFFLISELTSR